MPTTDNERFDALRERLSRQMLISGFGEEGQKKIIAARFLVIGAGGLGSPALLYLASAGACHITIVDPDEVSESNLSRQILHESAAIGLNKAQNAARELRRWNPQIEPRAISKRMNSEEDLLPSLRKPTSSSTARTTSPRGSSSTASVLQKRSLSSSRPPLR